MFEREFVCFITAGLSCWGSRDRHRSLGPQSVKAASQPTCSVDTYDHDGPREVWDWKEIDVNRPQGNRQAERERGGREREGEGREGEKSLFCHG